MSDDEETTEETPCQAPLTCGEFCLGFCQQVEVVAPTCDMENPEICESCT